MGGGYSMLPHPTAELLPSFQVGLGGTGSCAAPGGGRRQDLGRREMEPVILRSPGRKESIAEPGRAIVCRLSRSRVHGKHRHAGTAVAGPVPAKA